MKERQSSAQTGRFGVVIESAKAFLSGEKNGGYDFSNPKVDAFLPIETLFESADREAIVLGNISEHALNGIFASSPAGKTESEMIITAMVVESLKKGQWVSVVRPSDRPMGGKRRIGNFVWDFSKVNLEFVKGSQRLCQAGFTVIDTDKRGREWLKPTKKMAEFVSGRVKKEWPELKKWLKK